MRFSRFAPFGLARFAGGVPLAQRIYEALWSNLTDGDRAPNYRRGGYTDAKVYATAMALARWQHTARRLDLQISPDTVLELLPAREEEFGVVVPAGATIAERRAALRLAMRSPGDGSYGDIRQALEDVLGARFVQLRRLPTASQDSKPDIPGNGPGLFLEPGRPRKLFKLLHNVSSPGQLSGDEPFQYVRLDGSYVPSTEWLEPAQWFVIEPGHNVLQERRQVAVATALDGVAALRAILTKPHHAGALISTAPYPYLYSTRRHWIVRLTAAAALVPEARRLTNLLMARATRGVTTWEIQGNDGPFKLGVSPLGITPLG